MPNGGFLTLVCGSRTGGLRLNASVSANGPPFSLVALDEYLAHGVVGTPPATCEGLRVFGSFGCLEEGRSVGGCWRGAESEWAAARLISGPGWPSENHALRHAKQNRELAVGKSQVSDGLPLFNAEGLIRAGQH